MSEELELNEYESYSEIEKSKFSIEEEDDNSLYFEPSGLQDLEVYKEIEEGIVTDQHLKDISRELGLIKLCWAEVPQIDYEDRLFYPSNYINNNKKEKLVLWYAENFRQQFNYKYSYRRPLLIACSNECGVQKMVCTTIRPTNIKFPEFQTWQGCSSFVAEHLTYEELESPTVLLKSKIMEKVNKCNAAAKYINLSILRTHSTRD